MIGYCPSTIREPLFRKQEKFLTKRKLEGNHTPKSSESSENDLNGGVGYRNGENEDLTKSVDETASYRRARANSGESVASSFVQSVVVIPAKSEGKYDIYRGVHDQRGSGQDGSYDWTSSFLESCNYGHNINNPDRRLHRTESEFDIGIQRKLFRDGAESSSRKLREPRSPKLSSSSDAKCNCREYHSHTFDMSNINQLIQCNHWAQESMSLSSASTVKKSADVTSAYKHQLTINSIFWNAGLAFSSFEHGNGPVEFSSLWPNVRTVREILQDEIGETGDMGLREALSELCMLSIVCGPLSVLKNLLDLNYIRIDHQFDNDAGLLHLACVLQNMEAVHMLTQNGVSPKLKDKSGKTAGQVCYCARTRKQLPVRYQDRSKVTLVNPGIQDRDAIFRLAANPKHLYELQKKLQMFEFDVNTNSRDGDFLLHIACKAGLCQLPLIMSLLRIQRANIELCNAEGLTPLMIVAQNGDKILADLLMCLFNANPNEKSSVNGRTALHHAVRNNHLSIVNCLLKRGADVNMEDSDHFRADDILHMADVSADDCCEAIQLQRVQRHQLLSEKVTEDEVFPVTLRPTDIAVVDADGYTLIMLAVRNNRIHNLEKLLAIATDMGMLSSSLNGSTQNPKVVYQRQNQRSTESAPSQTCCMNAQHGQTGLTALAMAAKAGHKDCCSVLLKYGANPSIADMKSYLPIHHAVLANHEGVVDAFIKEFPLAYVGLFEALRLCRSNSIHEKLNKAWEKRQEEIINPQLRICSLEGNAEQLFCVLEEGDNVNSKSDLNSQPALFVAVESCHIEVVRLLIERGAHFHKYDQRTGNTVLHVVARTGHLEMAKYLLSFCHAGNQRSKYRLDINAVNNDRKTALQIAAESGYIKLISLLIKEGATTALLDGQGSLFTCPEFEGARVQIENHRQEHTQQVMALIVNKSRKSLMSLEQIFKPRFDHNLRDRNGDTPLMLACRHSRLDIVKFLIQSAVYANQMPGDNSLDDGSHDSGVPEMPSVVPPWKSHVNSVDAELINSIEETGEFDQTLPRAANDLTRSLNPSDLVNSLHGPPSTGSHGTHLNSYLTDLERPKGLYIYHDGIVSHICAVNLFDGKTPLLRAIESGDHAEIANLLLTSDGATINMQDSAGLTALHLACKLKRKKVLQILLMVPGLDLNLPSLNGLRPEELTTNKMIIKMVQTARGAQPVRQPRVRDGSDSSSVINSFTNSHPGSLGKASTVDFDKVEDMLATLRQSQRLQDSRRYQMSTKQS